MDVLATRVLSYPDEKENLTELLLTIFMPYEVEKNEWNCAFVFGPPIQRPQGKITEGIGTDFLQAFLSCLKIARGYFEGTSLRGRLHWQGMYDCGLPWHRTRPAGFVDEEMPLPGESAGSMAVLGIRETDYAEENGVEKPTRLTVFAPFKAEDEVWKCGFTFDPLPNAMIRYGVGADVIEALLDCLVKARVTFNGTRPKGWPPPGENFDCDDFPYKIGRSFWTDPVPRQPMPVEDGADG
jgi:hypothetical protein